MALKDKLVTLEDLQAVYNKIIQMVGEGEMWNDITGDLTWNTGKAVKRQQAIISSQPTYIWSWEAVDSGDTGASNGRYAIIEPEAGEKYRITGWAKKSSSSDNYYCGLYAMLNSSGNLISFGGSEEFGYADQRTIEKTACGGFYFISTELTIPEKCAKLMVLNWNKQMDSNYSLSDIIVEKAVTA